MYDKPENEGWISIYRGLNKEAGKIRGSDKPIKLQPPPA